MPPAGFLRHTLWLVALLVAGLAPALHAREVIPPRPAQYFNDYAGVVPAATARQLNDELAQFERATSNQILVAVYPKMQSDSSVVDYCVRVAHRWGVGQKGKDNGAVLFVFQQSHQIWIATGYGLEGALPDALCKRIIDDQIVPRFRRGDFAGGLTAGVQAMMAATRGEYKGTGRTVNEARHHNGGSGAVIGIFFVLVILMSALRARSQQKVVYGRRGRATVWTSGLFGGGWGMWGGGGWGGGGGGGGFGGGGGGFGGFSGGGGSFGGGGAGGSW